MLLGAIVVDQDKKIVLVKAVPKALKSIQTKKSTTALPADVIWGKSILDSLCLNENPPFDISNHFRALTNNFNQLIVYRAVDKLTFYVVGETSMGEFHCMYEMKDIKHRFSSRITKYINCWM